MKEYKRTLDRAGEPSPETPKKRGRPPKPRIAGAVIHGPVIVPNQGEQENLVALLRRYMVACSMEDQVAAVDARDTLVAQLDKFAGMR